MQSCHATRNMSKNGLALPLILQAVKPTVLNEISKDLFSQQPLRANPTAAALLFRIVGT